MNTRHNVAGQARKAKMMPKEKLEWQLRLLPVDSVQLGYEKHRLQ